MFIELLALVTAASFSSAAAYINLIEQPARLTLEPPALLTEWKPSYKRGTVMQVSLSVIAAVLGVVAFLMTQRWQWVAGTVFLLALLPYTLIGVMPINRRLMATAPEGAGESVRSEVRRWASRHAVRTWLGVAATLSFLWAVKLGS